MRSPISNSKSTGRLNISNLWPTFHSTKLAAAAIRILMTLPMLCSLTLIAPHPARAQTETVLYNFTGGADGGTPVSSLTFHAGNLYGTTELGGGGCQGNGSGTVFELSPNGSGGWNETVLYRFTGGADGGNPTSNVIFDSLGNLYGTTVFGGNGNGVVFELSFVAGSWTETVLYSFCSLGQLR